MDYITQRARHQGIRCSIIRPTAYFKVLPSCRLLTASLLVTRLSLQQLLLSKC